MEKWQLTQKQNLPLESKIVLSQLRIREFYEANNGNVFVSFSGGKDSTALLSLVRDIYPDVLAVFVDTGLEYPEIKEFVKSIPNVKIIRPELSFKEVIDIYGYPVISKATALKIRQAQTLPKDSISYRLRMEGINGNGQKSKLGGIPKKWKYLVEAPFKISEKCCDFLKKKPIHKFKKETGFFDYVGTMANDSYDRERIYLKHGCNAFDLGKSTPLAFWHDSDIWEFLTAYNIPYCKIYEHEHNTGCIFCLFGIHLEEEPNRIQRLKILHPKLYTYCIDTLELGEVLDYIGVRY